MYISGGKVRPTSLMRRVTELVCEPPLRLALVTGTVATWRALTCPQAVPLNAWNDPLPSVLASTREVGIIAMLPAVPASGPPWPDGLKPGLLHPYSTAMTFKFVLLLPIQSYWI